MNVIEQITALGLLIDFFFGITFGVVGGAVFGSRRGALLGSAAVDPLSAGAQVVYGVYVRDDDGYLRDLLPGEGRPSASDDQRAGDNDPGSPGKGADQ